MYYYSLPVQLNALMHREKRYCVFVTEGAGEKKKMSSNLQGALAGVRMQLT